MLLICPILDRSDIFYEQRWRFHPVYSRMADNYSTEVVIIALAVSVAQAFDNKYFDIRWVGVIHAALRIACFALVLPLFRRLSGWRRYAMPLFLLFVAGDVSYLVQFNSFHTDTAACIFLAWCIVIALRRAAGDWTGWRSLAALLLLGVLFIGAKPQHALLLASDLDNETCIQYIDSFLMFYIRTADPLSRTATWLNKMEGGIDYLRNVVVNDSLGMNAQ